MTWRRLHPGELDHELIWLLVSVVGAAIAVWWAHSGLPFPSCTFREVTGLPCPTCGATRATLQMMHGNLAAAVHFNPLVVLGEMAVALFDFYALTVLALRLPRLRLGPLRPAARRSLRWTAALCFVLNWLWLVRAGV